MEEKDAREYGDELLRMVDAFREEIITGTSNPDNFLTITDIEQLWTKLRGDTSLLYSDMLSDVLSEGVDESELIRKKKLNSDKKG